MLSKVEGISLVEGKMRCPYCGAEVSIIGEYATGIEARCPKCGAIHSAEEGWLPPEETQRRPG